METRQLRWKFGCSGSGFLTLSCIELRASILNAERTKFKCLQLEEYAGLVPIVECYTLNVVTYVTKKFADNSRALRIVS